MKKTLAMILALSMSCAMLASCGDTESPSANDTDTFSAAAAEDNSSEAEEDSEADESSEADENSEEEKTPDDENSEKEEEPSKEDGNNTQTGEGTMYEKLAAAVKESGAFTYGVTSEGHEAYVTTDGKSIYILSFGISQLTTADGTYLIDNEKMTYAKVEDDYGFDLTYSTYLDSITDMDGAVCSSVETETINGAEYTVETYTTSEDNFGLNFELKFAFNDKGELCYTSTTLGGEAPEYSESVITAEADFSKLDIDLTKYTEVAEEDFYQWDFNFDD